MLSAISNVAKFMRLYTRRKMYTVFGAGVEVFDLYKVFIPNSIQHLLNFHPTSNHEKSRANQFSYI